jgi:diphthamide synthase (EF-2-diphthine--ammonia ligase)
MSTSPKALIAWSSGKDSAWALHETRIAGEFEIVGALTTVTDAFHRVSMHGVREDLLRSQVDAAGLRAVIVHIPYPCSNVVYERKMAEAMAAARASGVTHMIFGDLFLEDVRAYRERQLSGTGIAPVFPLWGRPTRALAYDMIAADTEAYICRYHSPAIGSTARSLTRFRQTSTHVARTVNFTRSFRLVQCFRASSRSIPAKPSSAMDLRIQICCRLNRAIRRRFS